MLDLVVFEVPPFASLSAKKAWKNSLRLATGHPSYLRFCPCDSRKYVIDERARFASSASLSSAFAFSSSSGVTVGTSRVRFLGAMSQAGALSGPLQQGGETRRGDLVVNPNGDSVQRCCVALTSPSRPRAVSEGPHGGPLGGPLDRGPNP
eukprot:5906245-Pyramimonas_sp.AAC.1